MFAPYLSGKEEKKSLAYTARAAILSLLVPDPLGSSIALSRIVWAAYRAGWDVARSRNTEVKALNKLQVVRDANSSKEGSRHSLSTKGSCKAEMIPFS
jgi:hypothetical protein